MYSLIRQATWRTILEDELPSLSVAWLVAELFFKFHSFTLECLSFLALWFVLGWASATARTAVSRQR